MVDKRYEQIATTLREVKSMYRKAIEMPLEDQERIVLLLIKSMTAKLEILNIVDVIDMVLEQWSEGTPHDATLIDEVRKNLKPPYTKVLPNDHFDREMLVNKILWLEIESQFKPLLDLNLEKHEQNIVEELMRRTRNTLVDNPNFKGESPYYKRNPIEYCRSKPLWIELLDNDLDGYIDYFMDE